MPEATLLAMSPERHLRNSYPHYLKEDREEKEVEARVSTPPPHKSSMVAVLPTFDSEQVLADPPAIASPASTVPPPWSPSPLRKRASYATEFGSPLPLDTPRERLLFRTSLSASRSTGSSPLPSPLPHQQSQTSYSSEKESKRPSHATRPFSCCDEEHHASSSNHHREQLCVATLRWVEQQQQQQQEQLGQEQEQEQERYTPDLQSTGDRLSCDLFLSTLFKSDQENVHPLEEETPSCKDVAGDRMYACDKSSSSSYGTYDHQAAPTTFNKDPYLGVPLQHEELLVEDDGGWRSKSKQSPGHLLGDSHGVEMLSSGGEASSETLHSTSSSGGNNNNNNDQNTSSESTTPTATSSTSNTLTGTTEPISKKKVTFAKRRRVCTLKSIIREGPVSHRPLSAAAAGSVSSSSPNSISEDISSCASSQSDETSMTRRSSWTSANLRRKQRLHLRQLQFYQQQQQHHPSRDDFSPVPPWSFLTPQAQIHSRVVASQLLRQHQEQMHHRAVVVPSWVAPFGSPSSSPSLSPSPVATRDPQSTSLHYGHPSQQPNLGSLRGERRPELSPMTHRSLVPSSSFGSLKSVDLNGLEESGQDGDDDDQSEDHLSLPPPVPPKDIWYYDPGGDYGIYRETYGVLPEGATAPSSLPQRAATDKEIPDDGGGSSIRSLLRRLRRKWCPRIRMTGLGQRYPTADSLSFQTTESEDDVQKWWGGPYEPGHDDNNNNNGGHEEQEGGEDKEEEEFANRRPTRNGRNGRRGGCFPCVSSSSSNNIQWRYLFCTRPGVAYTAKHLLTTCLGILIIIAIALTARGRPRHPHMVSDEIPESLDGVIWAAQLVVLKDMDKIRKGFLDTPNLPADPDDDTGDEDRRSGRPPHLQRRWIDSDEPMDDSAVAEDDSMDEGSGTSKPHVWSNKGVNRHGEENVPIWHLPVKSACVQATCQLDAHIDPSDNKFFAFMDPETYDIRLPKNWPSLCMSCIEISRSQFVYRTRVRLWGDLWPCLDHPIPSEARAQVMFPIGNGTTITPVSAAAAAVTTATKEVKGAAAVPDVPHHYTAPRKGIHKVSDRRKNSITSGPSTTLPSRRKGAIQTTAPGVASTGVESKKHPPAAAAAAHGSATAPRPAHRRRDVAPQDVGSAQKSPSHVPPKQTNSPHQRKQHPQEQKQQGQQGQQGQRNPPPFQHQAGHSLSESPLDDEDLASLPWLVVDPATFENLTQYESPLSLLQSNRVTAEFRFVLCED